MIATRSPILIASSISWVTKMTACGPGDAVSGGRSAGDRIDRAEWLVHQHDRGIRGHRPGDRSAAAGRLRILRDSPEVGLRVKANQLGQFRRAGPDPLL